MRSIPECLATIRIKTWLAAALYLTAGGVVALGIGVGALALELRTILRTAICPAYLARWIAGIALLAVGWTAYFGLSFGRGYAAAVRGSDHDPLLDDVQAQITAPRDDGWGHDGRLPPWGELRDGDRARTAADD